MLRTIKLGEEEHPILLGTEAVSIIENKKELKGGDDNGFAWLNNKENLRTATNLKIIVYAGIVNGYLYNDEKCPISLERVGALMDNKKLDEYLLVVYSTLSDEAINVDDLQDELKKKTAQMKKVS